MAEIIWNPKWQLNPPTQFDFNSDGSVTFEGPVGSIFLPDDYIGFMQVSGGAALRDKGSWFIARFDGDGVALMQIEWLGSLDTVMFGTWRLYETPEPETHRLPQKYVTIGFADPANPDGADVVMNVNRDDPDYGKVYVWITANDPWMTGDNTKGLGYVADSFTDFMNGLTDRENL